MRAVQLHRFNPRPLLQLTSFFVHSWLFACDAFAAPSVVHRRDNNPLNIDWSPAPPPEEGPPLSAGALRDPAFLPAQIGGIVGSYALSLVLVAAILLYLSKKRRIALTSGDEEIEFDDRKAQPSLSLERPLSSPRNIIRSPVRNFSYPSPDKEFHPYIFPSPTSANGAPGVDQSVDQRIVAADKIMAQQQLEDIYKYVMEQEEAKANGVAFDPPSISSSTASKKEKNKPAHLILGDSSAKSEKTHSRTSSILSALRSPRKSKGIKGISISSPIMTPMSGTFPPQEGREMSNIPPRHYAPAPPPPVPSDQAPFGAVRTQGNTTPLTPEYSPESTQSIDERIGAQFGANFPGHSRNNSNAPTINDPLSAVTDDSQTPLVGLPSSPRASRFPSLPSLPSSPKPGQTFSRPNPPSAVRTGGALPLRAYEPSMSPSASSQQTKQTTFERTGPLSPMSGRTPYTGAAVPYSPYQPFTPCVPITPSLVTKADRKRMKRFEPKTPTVEMVKSSEDVW
jgi:hypothetical protein